MNYIDHSACCTSLATTQRKCEQLIDNSITEQMQNACMPAPNKASSSTYPVARVPSSGRSPCAPMDAVPLGPSRLDTHPRARGWMRRYWLLACRQMFLDACKYVNYSPVYSPMYSDLCQAHIWQTSLQSSPCRR